MRRRRSADATRDMRVVDDADEPPPDHEQRRVAFILLNFAAGDEFHEPRAAEQHVPPRREHPRRHLRPRLQAYFDEVSYAQEHFVSTIRDPADPEDHVYGYAEIEQLLSPQLAPMVSGRYVRAPIPPDAWEMTLP